MKLNHEPQAGLRRRRADRGRERAAFWGGLVIMALFEAVLMAKNWTPTGLHWPAPDQAEAAAVNAPDVGSASGG
jgi:hypothetical protein